VLLGSASFLGFVAGPPFGTWLAGPVMGMSVGAMPNMVNWPALAVAVVGLPLLLLAPASLAGDNARSFIAAPPPTTVRVGTSAGAWTGAGPAAPGDHPGEASGRAATQADPSARCGQTLAGRAFRHSHTRACRPMIRWWPRAAAVPLRRSTGATP